MTDAPAILAEKFNLISYKNIKRDRLAELWEKANVLSAQNIFKVILSEKSLILMLHGLKQLTDVAVSPEEIVGAIRHLLNEATLAEMEKVKISLPEKKQRKRIIRSSKEQKERTTQPMEQADIS